MNEKVLRASRSSVVGLALLALWKIVSLRVPAYILPPPENFLAYSAQKVGSGFVLPHLLESVGEIIQGTAIGILLGLMFAFILHHSSTLRTLLMPLLLLVQITPKLSIAPLIVLWIGLGVESKIFLVALVVFFPVMTNILQKLGMQPRNLNALASIYQISGLRRFFVIDLPFVIPDFFTGLQIGLVQSVTAIVIGDFIGSERGLGYLAKLGLNNSDINLVLFSLLMLSLLGLLLFALSNTARRAVARKFAM